MGFASYSADLPGRCGRSNLVL